MENFSVYIIYSTKLKRFYTGTTDDFAKRLIEHNTRFYSDTFSQNGIPWESYLIITNLSSKQAYNIERHIKSMKS